MRFSKLLPVLPLFLFFICAVPVFADAKSDYEFQYSQYRQNYIEYTVLKNDYLGNQTLDNQQKAILAAKDTLKSRDLAKAGFADYILSLCQEKQTNYTLIKPFLDDLRAAKVFFTGQVSRSQSIITPADLLSFSASYASETLPHDRSFRTGVVACKISQLVRIQIESKNALDVILPKLLKPYSTPLETRITDLQSQGNTINDNINALTNSLFTEEQIQNIDSENYFSNISETVSKIKALQLKWIDSLIDIDVNYAHS